MPSQTEAHKQQVMIYSHHHLEGSVYHLILSNGITRFLVVAVAVYLNYTSLAQFNK